ncbi:MAG TPA: MASE1 domain-containing protein [Burkholderiaceae bacterium]|nr:MASE1 domain-containing protein [Burkholderiaceae bacterium]
MDDANSAHWTTASGTGSGRHWLRLGAIVIVYFLAGRLGLHFAFVHASASAVWPPTGIALAALLLFGHRVWPAILVGAFLVNVTTAASIASSIGIAAGNTLEAVVGALLVERYANGRYAFERARDFLLFALLAGLLSTAISATIGVTSLVLTDEAPWNAFGMIWLTWWLGDAAGALIVTPLLVLWGTMRSAGLLRQRPLEAVGLLLVATVTGALVLAHPALARYPLPFLCIPPLIWAAFRFGQREVATLVAVLALIATWSTVRGIGPFVMSSDNESLLLLQAFMATIVALTMPVAALVWERKAAEDERIHLLQGEQAARAEAEAANQAKDEFFAMLSHELRNPLAAIANAGQVLHAGPELAFARRAVDIINRQARHLARLVDDLLDVARVGSGKILLARERINLADAVRGSLAMLTSSGRLDQHRIEVVLNPVWVNADPSRLMQIIDNLLMNALRYTPAGGRIEVQTLRAGGDALLRVRDDGAGIAAELLPRIFDLFMQGPRPPDRVQGGLGVGLTLAHRLTLAHGGRITAESPGASRGSVFTVTLPCVEPSAPETASRPAAAADTAASRRILIIEDDADGREALRMQLTTAGHEVFEAATGTDGVEVAARIRPEIVLLDLGLPGLDGYQVARRLRAAEGCPRLIAITGFGQPEDRRRARDAGIDQHLVKPVDAAELLRLLA